MFAWKMTPGHSDNAPIGRLPAKASGQILPDRLNLPTEAGNEDTSGS